MCGRETYHGRIVKRRTERVMEEKKGTKGHGKKKNAASVQRDTMEG